jgi:hypothetical protein
MLPARLIRTSILAAVLLLGRSARADEESVTLDYQAPDACPARAAFETEVRARTSKLKFSSEGRHFEIRLEKAEAGWTGTLAIREQAGPASERSLNGTACDEVVSALALVVALAIDPEASTAPRSELALSSESEPKIEPKPTPKPLPVKKPAPPPAHEPGGSTPDRQIGNQSRIGSLLAAASAAAAAR